MWRPISSYYIHIHSRVYARAGCISFRKITFILSDIQDVYIYIDIQEIYINIWIYNCRYTNMHKYYIIYIDIKVYIPIFLLQIVAYILCIIIYTI